MAATHSLLTAREASQAPTASKTLAHEMILSRSADASRAVTGRSGLTRFGPHAQHNLPVMTRRFLLRLVSWVILPIRGQHVPFRTIFRTGSVPHCIIWRLIYKEQDQSSNISKRMRTLYWTDSVRLSGNICWNNVHIVASWQTGKGSFIT